MIKKLKDLENLLKDTSKEHVISRDLYNLLIKEKEKISSLLGSVEHKRSTSLLKVLLGEIISEQVGEEIRVPEIGLSKEMIQAIRVYASMNLPEENYEGAIPKYDVEYAIKRTKRILKNGQTFPKRLDAFKEKPEGSVAIFEVQQECYENELLQDLGCTSTDNEERKDIIGPMTMNISQIDWLCKQKKIVRVPQARGENKNDYRIFVSINDVLKTIRVCPLGDKDFSWGYSSKIQKGAKILLFTPTDIEDEEKKKWRTKR